MWPLAFVWLPDFVARLVCEVRLIPVAFLLNPLICPKQVLSPCGGTETAFNTLTVDVGAVGGVGCMAWVPSVGFGNSVIYFN